jgi:biotin operon repressor
MAGKYKPVEKYRKECRCGCGEVFMGRKNQDYRTPSHRMKAFALAHPRMKAPALLFEPTERKDLAGLLDHIPLTGWVSGKELSKWFGCSQRVIRLAIQQQRKAGAVVYSQQGFGYTRNAEMGRKAAQSLIARGIDFINLGRKCLNQPAVEMVAGQLFIKE